MSVKTESQVAEQVVDDEEDENVIFLKYLINLHFIIFLFLFD
jgi:hypothetical protein